MGSGGLLGIAVWHVCRRWPWPAGFSVQFYALQIGLALTYSFAWIAAMYGLDSLLSGRSLQGFWSWPSLARQTTIGIWLYGLYAGVSYAVQMRDHLQEKETLAARAEALAAEASFPV